MSVHRNMIGEIRVQRSSAQTVTEKVSFEVSPDRSRPKPSQLAGAMAAADAPGCESRATPFLYDSSAITKPSSPLPTIAQPVDGRPFIAATHDRACTGQRGSQGPQRRWGREGGREAESSGSGQQARGGKAVGSRLQRAAEAQRECVQRRAAAGLTDDPLAVRLEHPSHHFGSNRKAGEQQTVVDGLTTEEVLCRNRKAYAQRDRCRQLSPMLLTTSPPVFRITHSGTEGGAAD